ncbi:hypothetical protein LTR86_000895 [Recurvomyces mirabilis]|nr:hypothetical protein LTR86_000895 [Recurvomyces mirabilis]
MSSSTTSSSATEKSKSSYVSCAWFRGQSTHSSQKLHRSHDTRKLQQDHTNIFIIKPQGHYECHCQDIVYKLGQAYNCSFIVEHNGIGYKHCFYDGFCEDELFHRIEVRDHQKLKQLHTFKIDYNQDQQASLTQRPNKVVKLIAPLLTMLRSTSSASKSETSKISSTSVSSTTAPSKSSTKLSTSPGSKSFEHKQGEQEHLIHIYCIGEDNGDEEVRSSLSSHADCTLTPWKQLIVLDSSCISYHTHDDQEDFNFVRKSSRVAARHGTLTVFQKHSRLELDERILIIIIYKLQRHHEIFKQLQSLFICKHHTSDDLFSHQERKQQQHEVPHPLYISALYKLKHYKVRKEQQYEADILFYFFVSFKLKHYEVREEQ